MEIEINIEMKFWGRPHLMFIGNGYGYRNLGDNDT